MSCFSTRRGRLVEVTQDFHHNRVAESGRSHVCLNMPQSDMDQLG